MEYNYNQNYYNHQNSYNAIPRNLIKFAQIIGTFFSVLGLWFYIYYINDIYNLLSYKDENIKKTIISLILSIIVYFVWKSIYNAIVIINLVNKCSDEELCANRYIISSLSLTVGGLFTPFLITSFPNINTTSTIKPRYFLSKVMSFCVLIGAPIFVFSYFLSLITEINSNLNLKLIFNINSLMGIVSILVLNIGFLAFILGIIGTKLFFSKKMNNNLIYNNYSKLSKIISTIWMIILTIELAIIILFSIIRLIGALWDLLRSRKEGWGILMAIFSLFNLLITISYVFMIIHVVSKTIAGLWSVNEVVIIKKYKHNEYIQSHLIKNNINF